MVKEILSILLTSGAGVAIFLLILGRFLPNSTLFKLGASLSKFGRTKLGKVTWEKLEKHLIRNILSPFIHGLEADNGKKEIR